ncbi:MAG: hypothetical protein QHH13_07505 [Melioribacter sp.]|nr:hypothetical protein [Melioribacter sp.]
MARRRMIDPNFFISEDVSKLDIFERFVLIGLFSNADDYGKGRAKPEFLRSIIFPYDDIPVEKIKNALTNISKVISIKFYQVNNSSYYIFLNWNKWQRVEKPQPSLIPDPISLDKNSMNDSKNNSENDSKNDSENDSVINPEFCENDSSLKEKKKKEYKRKKSKGKEKEITPALSKNLSLINSYDNSFSLPEKIYSDSMSQPTEELITNEILIRSYGRLPTEAERDFIKRLINKFGEKKTLNIMKTAKLMNFKNFINLENSLDENGNFKEKNSNGIYAKYITTDKLKAITKSIANDPDLVR